MHTNRTLGLRRFAGLCLFFFLAALSITSHAMDPKIFVSLQDMKSDSKELTQKVCGEVQKESVGVQAMQVVCTFIPSTDLSGDKVKEILHSDSFNYHVEVIRFADGEKMEVRTRNLKPYDMMDFRMVSNLYSGNQEELIHSAASHIRQVGNFYHKQLLVRRQIVSQMAHFSRKVSIDREGRILDPKTGLSLTWEQVYEILTYETLEHEKVSRALIEISAMFAFASHIYHENIEENEPDFDYDKLKEKLKDTLLSDRGWSFDTNRKAFNTGHAFAGQMYYQAARSNGFSAFKSFAIAWTSSLLWELFGERREKASINDQIITPVGGAIIGEAGFQISRAIRKRSNSKVARAFAFVVDPVSGINRLINRLSGHRDQFLSDLTQEQYAAMETYIGRSLDETEAKMIGFQADVVNVDDFGQDGEVGGVIVDLAAVQATIEYSKNRLSEVDIKLITSVAWKAYHQKRIKNQSGYEAIYSVGSEFEVDKKSNPVKDFNLTVHMLGPQARVEGIINGFKIRADVAMYADFAMIQSLALAEYDRLNPNERAGLQSIIKEEGYYYGFGTTNKIRLALSTTRWTVFADRKDSRASSINSYDRFQEQVTQNFKYRDNKSVSEAGLSVNLRKNLKLTLKQERVARQSTIDNDYHGSYKVKRNWVQVNYQW